MRATPGTPPNAFARLRLTSYTYVVACLCFVDPFHEQVGTIGFSDTFVIGTGDEVDDSPNTDLVSTHAWMHTHAPPTNIMYVKSFSRNCAGQNHRRARKTCRLWTARWINNRSRRCCGAAKLHMPDPLLADGAASCVNLRTSPYASEEHTRS